MDNIIIIAVVLCIIVAIVFFLYRSKKRGEVCIGCPYAKQCGGKCSCETKPESGEQQK